MLLPSQKPSSCSLLKFVYVISQLVVHPLLRKILDPPLHPRLRAISLFPWSEGNARDTKPYYSRVFPKARSGVSQMGYGTLFAIFLKEQRVFTPITIMVQFCYLGLDL